jgi:hypothetical protein
VLSIVIGDAGPFHAWSLFLVCAFGSQQRTRARKHFLFAHFAASALLF